MESPTPRPARTACNVHGLILGLSKLCKLTKIGAAPPLGAENPKTAAISNGAGNEQKVVIIRLFEAITALKLAYVKLQQGYVPYDPTKIGLADELVASELESITALERLCTTPRGAGSAIDECWMLVQELEAKMRRKESDIIRLRREFEGLKRANSVLKKKVKRKPSVKHEKGSTVLKELTPSGFLEVFKLASTSMQDFAELIIGLMNASGQNLDNAVSAVDKKYAFEAYLSRTMLGGIENEGFDIHHFDQIMRFRDPFDALIQDPHSNFSRYCQAKYLATVSSEMEASFFGNLDQRVFVSRGGQPRTPLYRAFALMARSTWALWVMAHCIMIPSAKMFYAKSGSKFSKVYMESVVALVQDPCQEEKIRVAFTVMPGFKIGETVVACKVYPSNFESSIKNSDMNFS